MSQPKPTTSERDIFLDALEIADAGARRAFLDEACGKDRGLREAVDALLANHKMDGFLETPAVDGPEREAERGPTGTIVLADGTERPGDRIGRYKLLQEIGEGACGTVYMADQEEPVRRRVALKIIKPGMDTKTVIARFEAERQAVALMDHPNIAKVFDAGTTEGGRPYFVMELVRGVRITEYCDQNQLSTGERLTLFIKVCNAIQHAHQKGIIHRDIKPSNILVTLHDGEPVPKVIDFGIAKAIEQRLTEKTVFTHFQAFIGTPAYTSPEQAEMSGLDIDTRSDIYSLGVLLYELLTGETPFDPQHLLKSGLDEMRRIIREEEPLRPSTRLSTLGVAEGTALSRARQSAMPALVQSVRGDLDWIVMKCLEKDRTRRYATANALALDVQRYMENEPVLARPPSAGYRLRKFIRRNRVMVTTTAIVAVVLTGALILSTWLAIRALQAEKEQARSRKTAEGALANVASARTQAQRDRLEALHRAYTSDMNLVQQALAAGNHGRVIDLLDRQTPKTEPANVNPEERVPDFRQWEWRYFWRQSLSEASFAFPQQTNSIQQVALSPNDRLLLTSDLFGLIKLWDVRARVEVAVIRHGFGPSAFAFSRDGSRLALAGNQGPHRSNLKIFTVATREFTSDLPQEGGTEALAFTPDDNRLVTFGHDGVIRVWDINTLKVISETPTQVQEGRFRQSPVFSPDARFLALAHSGGVRVVDSQTGQLRTAIEGLEGNHWPLALSPKGDVLAVGPSFAGTNTAVKLFATATGTEIGELIGHKSWVGGLVFSEDGKRLVSAGADQTVRVWDLTESDRHELMALQGHRSEVSSVAISSDGKTVVSGCKDGSVLGWNLDEPRRHAPYETLPLRVTQVSFFPDSRTMLTANADGTVSLWDAGTLQQLERVAALGSNITRVLISSDGSRVFAGTWQGQVAVLDWATRLVITNLGGVATFSRRFGPGGSGPWPGGPGGPGGKGSPGVPPGSGPGPGGFGPGGLPQFGPLALAESSRILVTALPGGLVRLIDTTNWWAKGEWKTGETFQFSSTQLLLSPDERSLVVGGNSSVEFRELLTGKIEATFPAPNWGVSGLSFSPDGKLLAISSADGTVGLWDAADHKLLDVLRGHLFGVHAVGFSPDGERLASLSHGAEAVKLWDVATRHEVATLPGQGSLFSFVKFSPDSKLLVAINMQRNAYIWRAPSREEIAEIQAHSGSPAFR